MLRCASGVNLVLAPPGVEHGGAVCQRGGGGTREDVVLRGNGASSTLLLMVYTLAIIATAYQPYPLSGHHSYCITTVYGPPPLDRCIA